MANLREKFETAVSRHRVKTAISYWHDGKPRDISYEEFKARVDQFVYFLLKKGFKKGDKAAVMLNNCPDWPAIFFACMYIGVIVVPVNPESSREEINNILDSSESKILFTEKEITPGENKIDVIQDIEKVKPELSADDIACILYTSGTTDIPKGVMLTHGNLLSNCESIHSLGIVSPDDSVFSMLPLHHIYPLTVTMLLPVLYGSRIIYPGSFKNEIIVKTMREMKPTIFVGIPRIYNAFYQRIEERLKKIPLPINVLFNLFLAFTQVIQRKTGANLTKCLLKGAHENFGRKMKLFITGGAKLDESVARGLFKLGFTILEGYGLTETSPVLTFNPPSRPKIGSAGKAIPNVEINLSGKNEEGIGEVIARGPGIMKGYYKRQDLTDEVIKNGWFHTGDLGFIDKEGYLFLTGRLKDIIVLSSGNNVYPDEVERVYSKEPAVSQICVFDVPSKKEGGTDTALWAVVVPNQEFFKKVSAVNLKQLIKERFDNISHTVPPHMRLMGFSITLDELPRTLLGKVKRHRLKEIYLPKIMEEKNFSLRGKALSEEDKNLLMLESSQRIIECLKMQTKQEKEILPSDLLELDLGIDSLGRIELASRLEKTFNTAIGEEILGEAFTVRDLITGMEAALKGGYTGTKGRFAAEEAKYWHTLLEVPPREENLKKIDLKAGLGARLFTFFLHGFLYLIFKIFYNLKIEGKENIPRKGPYILYVNHTSYFDGLLAAASMPVFSKPDLFFVGYSVYFDAPVVRNLKRIARGIPLDFSTHFLEALRSSYYVLKNGKNLCLFPEGLRTLDGKLGEFKNGFGILAKETGAKLLPMLIEGAFEAWPRTAKFPKRGQIKVKIGRPIEYQEVEKTGHKLGDGTDYEAVCLGAREELLSLGQILYNERMKRYEEIPHTADYAARIYGKTIKELFENAAYAMFDMMADLNGLEAEETVDVEAKAPDTEDLLISWLNELLYNASTKEMLFSEFCITDLGDKRIAAKVKGQKLSKCPGRVRSEIKAATYHDLKIIKRDSTYEVTIVFDV